MFHEARSGFTSFTVHKLTFREDKDRASSKTEETTQTDASSSLPMSQRQGPPGNMDPTLGRVDWDEFEMEAMHVGLDSVLKKLGKKV